MCIRDRAQGEGALSLPICAKIEEDIADMSAEDKALFLGELGLEESGLDRLIKVCYELLGLISYPVSYTHLDVYKRQLVEAVKHLLQLFFGDPLAAVSHRGEGCLLYTSRCV